MPHSRIGHGGPLVLLIAATLEGPIVTVVPATLAQKGMKDIRRVLPAGLRRRLGLDRHVIQPLATRFRQGGGRLLIVSKLTHVAGLPLWRFLLFTAVATVPKVAALCLWPFLRGRKDRRSWS